MKELFFKNWHLMRWVRLGFSLFLIVQAFQLHEWIFLAFAAFFLFQAIFNLGCSSTGCSIPTNKNKTDE